MGMTGLRALLIQKDVKPYSDGNWQCDCLRALLIQKDVKHIPRNIFNHVGLRALLIQKDVKPQTRPHLFF